MEYGTIPGLDKKVSRIVQGTVMLNSEDPEPGYALLDGVYAAGCTAFDTARHYGGGIEIVFGQWVRDRGLRDEVMLIGKGAHHSPERRRVTPQDIADDLDVSLGQFGLDYIDLYLLHRDDPEVPVGPIVEALAGHQRAGKIGAYGGSNWSHTRIAEANVYAAANGLAPFVASSPNYSLAVWTEPPWPECVTLSGPDGKDARAWYAEQKMPVIPWSSLAGGFFSGRFRRDNLDTFTNYYDRRLRAQLRRRRQFQAARPRGSTGEGARHDDRADRHGLHPQPTGRCLPAGRLPHPGRIRRKRRRAGNETDRRPRSPGSIWKRTRSRERELNRRIPGV